MLVGLDRGPSCSLAFDLWSGTAEAADYIEFLVKVSIVEIYNERRRVNCNRNHSSLLLVVVIAATISRGFSYGPLVWALSCFKGI